MCRSAFANAATLSQADPDYRHLAVLPEAVAARSGRRLVGHAARSLGLARHGRAQLAERLAHACFGTVLGAFGVGLRLAQDRGNQ